MHCDFGDGVFREGFEVGGLYDDLVEGSDSLIQHFYFFAAAHDDLFSELLVLRVVAGLVEDGDRVHAVGCGFPVRFDGCDLAVLPGDDELGAAGGAVHRVQFGSPEDLLTHVAHRDVVVQQVVVVEDSPLVVHDENRIRVGRVEAQPS